MYEVPREYLSEKQIIQIDASRKHDVHYDHRAIKEFVDSLWYPLYFLDFETFTQAIPPYDGTWPFQKIPFQYSLHHMDQKDGELKLNAQPAQDRVHGPRYPAPHLTNSPV